ncbi:hypothetical protein [Aquimarina algicola]|uniref:DUF2931 family protein n=1 Tax=Aquimarina algicola TaxID=2589995 RepID=A0A504JJW0_9FLAO|nr:hypothetical protein [Aquimarina algicola]TPN86820.1 hypothetical protein FHK87_04235 [Aquimarina algicola]
MINIDTESFFKIIFFVLIAFVVYIIFGQTKISTLFQAKNIIKIVVFIISASIIYIYSKDPVISFLSSKTLPKEVASYKSLSEAPLVSDNYEMVPLFIQNKRRGFVFYSLLYDQINDSNYIIGFDKNRQLEHTAYWKLSNQGDVIDSISVVDPRLFNCGVFFESDYYIDWFNTGDKAKKKYLRIIDDENLSLDEIKNYIDEAIMIDVGVDYSNKENTVLELFLLSEGGWTRLKSKKLYNAIIPVEEENDYQSKGKKELFEMEDSETFSIRLEKYLGIFKKRFTTLKKEEHVSPEKKCAIQIEAFEKKQRFKPPFFSMTSYGYAGWYGTGFVKLKSRSISFPFKLEAFENEDGVIRTGIELYYPMIEKGKDLIIVKVGSKKNREQLQDYYGLYVLRKKNL